MGLLFNELIKPITKEKFFDTYYEEKEVFIEGYPQKVKHLFSIELLEEVLLKQHSHSNIRRVEKTTDGDVFEAPSTLNNIPIGALFEDFYNGKTIIVNAINKMHPPIDELARAFSEIFFASIQVNMYVTPPGKTGFAPHWDDHDVFILQIAGEKDWSLYKDGPNLPHPIDGHLSFKQKETYDNAYKNLLLQQGDLLYIPRGLVHSATSRETTSIHLTIGISGISYSTVLETLIRTKSLNCKDLRKTFIPNQISAENLSKKLHVFLTDMNDEIDTNDLVNNLKVKLIKNTSPPKTGHFRTIGVVPLDKNTVFKKSYPDLLCIIEQKRYCYLITPDFTQHVPIRGVFTLENILRLDTFSLDDVKCFLNDDECLALLKRLFSIGVINLV